MAKVAISLVWPIVLLTLAAGKTGTAAKTNGPVTPQIAAQCTAEVRATPDRAVVRFGVQFDAPEAQAAQGRARERVVQGKRVDPRGGRIVKNNGTERLVLTPVPGHKGRPRRVGYHSSTVLRVEL